MPAIVRAPARPQPPGSNVPSAVLIDGSAVFQSSRTAGDTQSKLDYRALVNVLCREIEGLMPSGSGPRPTPWVMWTAAAPDNAGQNNFLEFVERELHWEVRRSFPSQAFVVEPSAIFGIGGGDSSRVGRLIRFDAAIGFAMGRLADTHRIVVVSDSYPLCEPMVRVNEHLSQNTGQCVLAFFGRSLDPRWLVAGKQQNAPRVMNLDEHESELFGTPRKEESRPVRKTGNIVF